MKFLANESEKFYTDSKNKKEDLVDQISIDVLNKEYVLDLEVPISITDGYDEDGNEIYAIYISREVFDILLQGLKLNNYNQIQDKK